MALQHCQGLRNHWVAFGSRVWAPIIVHVVHARMGHGCTACSGNRRSRERRRSLGRCGMIEIRPERSSSVHAGGRRELLRGWRWSAGNVRRTTVGRGGTDTGAVVTAWIVDWNGGETKRYSTGLVWLMVCGLKGTGRRRGSGADCRGRHWRCSRRAVDPA